MASAGHNCRTLLQNNQENITPSSECKTKSNKSEVTILNCEVDNLVTQLLLFPEMIVVYQTAGGLFC